MNKVYGFGLFQQLNYNLSLPFTPGLQSAGCVLHWPFSFIINSTKLLRIALYKL